MILKLNNFQGSFMSYRHTVLGGITAGNIIAGLLSWHIHHDLFWAIIDFFLSWIYVFYAAVVYYHFDFIGIFNQAIYAIQTFFQNL